jgi:hypothetical protein
MHGGQPMVDTSIFPDMAQMVSYGAAKNVKMGFYGNNCRCNGGQSAADKWMKIPKDVEHYAQDAQFTLDAGFAGTKIDSCGDQRDMNQYASRFAAAGKELLVRCAFFDMILHSRMPLDPTHVRFKR